jgi:fructose/tagatose bisphosphate aldolase
MYAEDSILKCSLHQTTVPKRIARNELFPSCTTREVGIIVFNFKDTELTPAIFTEILNLLSPVIWTA